MSIYDYCVQFKNIILVQLLQCYCNPKAILTARARFTVRSVPCFGFYDADRENEFEAYISSHVVDSFALPGDYRWGMTKVGRVIYAVVGPEVLRTGGMVDIGDIHEVGAVQDQRAKDALGFTIDKTRSDAGIIQGIGVGR